MSVNVPPPPHYPSDDISLRAYVERMIADLSATVKQKWDDISVLTQQRWTDATAIWQQRWEDHTAVHARDAVALTRALEQATTALAAALEAHRREHAIAESAQTKADATHQTQHQALNELRDVVGDLTSHYVPLSSMANITDSWERRWSERAKEFDSYRDALAKEQASYRDTVRAEIATLRESKSNVEGREHGNLSTLGDRRASSADARGNITLAISAGLALLGVITFVLAQGRTP